MARIAREKHISSADYEVEKKARRKKRAIIFLVAFLVMAAAGVAEIIILKSMTSVDRRFIREVERSVAAGWESGKSDLQLREQGRITDTSFITDEYKAARVFAGKTFQDKKLKKLAKRYVSDLKKCRNAASAYDAVSDSEAFWDAFAKPYTDRLKVLSKLYYGDYQMGGSWEAYHGELSEVLSRAWAAEKITQLEFARTGSQNGIGEYTAVLKNDSGYDIEFLNLDLDIYDSNDALVGTAEVYKEGIADGSSAELIFYFTENKASSYKIIGVDFEAAQMPE